ncbi:MAG: hypothetical protein K0S70_4395, partial [Microbacterium sp.]|nr:hypothetical protein [Microbacterium sp.]
MPENDAAAPRASAIHDPGQLSAVRSVCGRRGRGQPRLTIGDAEEDRVGGRLLLWDR